MGQPTSTERGRQARLFATVAAAAAIATPTVLAGLTAFPVD